MVGSLGERRERRANAAPVTRGTKAHAQVRDAAWERHASTKVAHRDVRDAAQAVRLALESQLKGAEVFIIANADSVMSRKSTELMAETFPDVAFRQEVAPHEALMSSEKAKRLLGFEPQHSWR